MKVKIIGRYFWMRMALSLKEQVIIFSLLKFPGKPNGWNYWEKADFILLYLAFISFINVFAVKDKLFSFVNAVSYY